MALGEWTPTCTCMRAWNSILPPPPCPAHSPATFIIVRPNPQSVPQWWIGDLAATSAVESHPDMPDMWDGDNA